MKTKLSDALWSDCETDEDRVNFLLIGRGYETGIIAKAIQHEVAMAFQFRDGVMKERLEPTEEYMGPVAESMLAPSICDHKEMK